MFNFFNTDFNRIATAAVGALVLSTACIGAAVGPASSFESGAGLVVAEAGGAQTEAQA